MSSQKDVRDFIRRLEKAGLTVRSIKGGRYAVERDGVALRRPDGQPFRLPSTPGQARWRKNATVELRKLGVKV